ncbi:DUF2993 domain-containing protein [Streptomyces sp. NPDC090306]|uniref:LmeA family phospholipid-binding protein n=1 Tax=Streptomyces sp. NPDC090306 TaxID=3365961 RepID=UPI0038032FC3
MAGRWVKILVGTVVVLGVLFVVVDRVAVHYADKEVADLAKDKYGYANTTDAELDVSIEGFPFLTQALAKNFHDVELDASNFYVDAADNAQGGYLHIADLHLDLSGVTMPSYTARTAQANLATGTVTLSYSELSSTLTRLVGHGSTITVSQASGSKEQAANVRISGSIDGTQVNGVGTLLAQGDEFSLTAPGQTKPSASWRLGLPQNVGFSAAESTTDGVKLTVTGHQVTLGSSRFGG